MVPGFRHHLSVATPVHVTSDFLEVVLYPATVPFGYAVMTQTGAVPSTGSPSLCSLSAPYYLFLKPTALARAFYTFINVFARSVVAQVKTPCVFYDSFPLLALLQALSKLLLTHVLTLAPQLCLSLPVMALQWHLSRCVSVLSMLCWVWPYPVGISTQPLAQLTVSCNTNFILSALGPLHLLCHPLGYFSFLPHRHTSSD